MNIDAVMVEVSRENVREWAALCAELWHEESRDISEWVAEWESGELPCEFLRYENGEAAAFISLSIRHDYVEGTESAPVGYLEGIYVKPQFRKRGIARAMVEFAKSRAAERGCVEFASDCELPNEAGRRFHTAVGFAEVNRIICFAMRLDN